MTKKFNIDDWMRRLRTRSARPYKRGELSGL
jgi:hypothetical protein